MFQVANEQMLTVYNLNAVTTSRRDEVSEDIGRFKLQSAVASLNRLTMADRTTHRRKAARQSAAEFKAAHMNRDAVQAADRRAGRIAGLNEMADTGTMDDKVAARKAKAAMRDTWVRRQSNNVTGFAKPQGNRPRKDAGTVLARPALAPVPGTKAYKVAR